MGWRGHIGQGKSVKQHYRNSRQPILPLADRRLANMAIVVAAMRKLIHIVFGVLKNQRPFDPDYGNQFAFTS
jgi:hypothetical protein